MSQVSHIDVEVRPSQGYQTVGFTARLVFAEPVSLEEAKFEADLAYSELEDLALKKIDFLKSKYTNGDMAPVARQAAPAQMQSNGSLQWAIAHKPNGAGSFEYLTTSSFPSDRFVSEAKAQIPALGIPEDQVVVFDDRGGAKGIEAGNEYYCAGKVKARSDSNLAKAMQGKLIVGNVDFNKDGTLKVSLSRDGKAAVGALSIASQFASMDATPF
jgi:hypothetical protein